MHVYVIFAHPSQRSFSKSVLDAFTRGLQESGHSVEVADLYRMSFQSEMDEAQYLRETSGDPDLPVPRDVEEEQAKIDRADGLVFIYPVWWSDCPAKLKGWFDRILTYGYAYVYEDDGTRGTKMSVEKALVLCSAGHTVEHLEVPVSVDHLLYAVPDLEVGISGIEQLLGVKPVLGGRQSKQGNEYDTSSS